MPTFNLALSRLLTDWCSQDLIEVLPAAVYVCNAAAVVVAYNRRAVELWGREPALGDSDEKYCGAHRLYHLDGTPLPHRETPMELVLRTGEPARDRQVIIERPDGSRITALVNIAPLFAEAGKLAGAVNCFQDLTAQEEAARERIRLEEELLQAQKIDVLGHLTAGVAHDFNNLLAAVFGNLEMLKKRTLDTGSQRLLHNATHAVENGERLIQQLLAFVRKEELSPKAVDLNQLLGGMLQLLQTSIGGTIRVEMRKQPGLWPVLVDRNQFELVLLNLAINARDAMPEGGTLTIEARNSNFGASDRPRDLSAGDCAVLSIRDTGTGMSEAVRLRAFDPFFTTKGPGKGSGLGLSMALRVAKQSGGTVRIDSRPGEGTMIEVYLPRAEMAAASKDLQGNGHAKPGLAAAGAMTPEVVGLGKPGIVEPMQRARDVFPSRPAARRIGEPDVSRAAKSTD